jgi:hypothetical protein
MADALLVFNPLQEFCFFVVRAPHLDQMGVTPLLRRRLLGLQAKRFPLTRLSFSLLVFQARLLVSSLTLANRIFCLATTSTTH